MKHYRPAKVEKHMAKCCKISTIEGVQRSLAVLSVVLADPHDHQGDVFKLFKVPTTE